MKDNSLTSFRLRAAIPDDADAIASLVNDCSVERTGKPQTTAQPILGLMHMPGLQLETDSLLVIGPHEKILGYAVVQDTAPHTTLSVLADVHPENRGRGLGSTLCRWAEARARLSLPLAPPGERVVLVQKRCSTDAPARDLLVGQGYRVVGHYLRMTVELEEPPPQPVVPAGITVRPFVRDREGRALVRALREVFRESWGYAERPFDEEYQRWMHILDREPDHDPSPFWFVAVDGAEIAGLCLCDQCDGGDAETAWVHAVGVRTAWRGQGLVLALLHHSFGMLYQQGRRRISLEVDAQSPTGATHLYDRAGMHVERRYDLYEKEVRLEERALRNLADAAANRHRRGDWIPWEQKRESHGAVLSA